MTLSGVLREETDAPSQGTATVLSRLAAFGFDYVLIVLYLGVLRVAVWVDPEIKLWFSGISTAHLSSFLVLTLPVSVYFLVSESSVAEATLGKRLMHIRVESLDGHRLTFSASIVRTTVKFIPWELSHAAIWRMRFAAGDSAQVHVATALMTAGWLFVLVNIICVVADKRRRTLYDFAAQSLVVRDTPS
jgi:uncharacterized RDD family membrane protein YckC